jgi:cytochrome c
MNGKEFNKIAAGLLIAGLIAMISGKIVETIYKPNLHPAKRGYSVEVSDQSGAVELAKPEVFQIDIKELMHKASNEAGAKLFTKCSACHTAEKGGANRVGPNLWDVVGRKRASHEGYTYSSSMIAFGGEWSYEELAHFLHKPGSYIKGTKMGFAGFSKQEDIANIIAYLRTLSDSPHPLP